MPRTTRIWDLPVRLFHWALALGFFAAATIALLLGEHAPLFPYHAIIGLTLACMVALRILWGLVGTRHARFTDFAYGPASVVAYLRGIATGAGRRFIGHNPASAYAIFAMLGLVLAMAATGIAMATGNESVEDIHGILAWVLVGVVAVHILGVIIHTIRHRENITVAMIDGRKDADAAHAIGSSRPIVALLFLAITGWWAASLYRSFDPATGIARIPLLGTPLKIAEDGAGDESEERTERTDSDHDDAD
jgi:cytochrome b